VLSVEPVHQSLIVKVKKDKKVKDCRKARCEPGMFVLEKPNIYGACCQATAEPLAPKTSEPEKCKFPGEVGPPCHCPDGTTFIGYKGCVPNPYWTCTGMTKESGPFSSTFRAVSSADARAAVRKDMQNKNRTIIGQLNCGLN
jgi:hypothetical protein